MSLSLSFSLLLSFAFDSCHPAKWIWWHYWSRSHFVIFLSVCSNIFTFIEGIINLLSKYHLMEWYCVVSELFLRHFFPFLFFFLSFYQIQLCAFLSCKFLMCWHKWLNSSGKSLLKSNSLSFETLMLIKFRSLNILIWNMHSWIKEIEIKNLLEFMKYIICSKKYIICWKLRVWWKHLASNEFQERTKLYSFSFSNIFTN